MRGVRPEELAYEGAANPLREVFVALRANVRAVLEEVTVADVAFGELPDRVRELVETPTPGRRTSAGDFVTGSDAATRGRQVPGMLQASSGGSPFFGHAIRLRPWNLHVLLVPFDILPTCLLRA